MVRHWLSRVFQTTSRLATRRRPTPRLMLEQLEARELLTVQFTPTPFTTRPNSPDSDLFTLGGFNETLVAVNPTNPGNVAVADNDGVRVSTNYGATFSVPGGPVGELVPLTPFPTT